MTIFKSSSSTCANTHISVSRAGIICVVIVLALLIFILKKNVLDNFIVFLDENVIPSDCYNYLVTDSKQFYLLDTRKLYDEQTNPMPFSTRESAIAYLKGIGCSTAIPFINLLKKKKKDDDPTVSYERECNIKVAPNLFDLDICNTYGEDYDLASAASFAKINKIESDRSQYANFNVETCMIDRAVKMDPELDDTNFKQYFSTYFDRLNDNIDEQFLYVSSN
jgi:hypothetical protein